jgi:hypothetical protein
MYRDVLEAYKCCACDVNWISIKYVILHYIWLHQIILYFNNVMECLCSMSIFSILFFNTCVPHMHFTSIYVQSKKLIGVIDGSSRKEKQGKNHYVIR